MTPPSAIRAAILGMAVAFTVMGIYAARVAYTVTRTHRWYQLKHL